MGLISIDVRQFVIENFLFGDGSELTDSASFLESAIIDSTGILELVGFVERRFGITVEDHELVAANLDSIERVTQYVSTKLRARESSLAG